MSRPAHPPTPRAAPAAAGSALAGLRGAAWRRLVSGLACLAVLIGALAPHLSSALAFRRGEFFSLLDVCAARVTAGADNLGGTRAPVKALQAHCPFCLPHAGSVGLPPVSSIALAVPTPVAEPPLVPIRLRVLRGSFPWRTGQPRAPPVA